MSGYSSFHLFSNLVATPTLSYFFPCLKYSRSWSLKNNFKIYQLAFSEGHDTPCQSFSNFSNTFLLWNQTKLTQVSNVPINRSDYIHKYYTNYLQISCDPQCPYSTACNLHVREVNAGSELAPSKLRIWLWNVQQGLCHSLLCDNWIPSSEGRRADLIPPSSNNNGPRRTQKTVLLTHTPDGKRTLRAVQKKHN